MVEIFLLVVLKVSFMLVRRIYDLVNRYRQGKISDHQISWQAIKRRGEDLHNRILSRDLASVRPTGAQRRHLVRQLAVCDGQRCLWLILGR